MLRGAAGNLRLSRIVEKGFFIDSTKSRVLQLCDLCALTARKMEESSGGGRTEDSLGGSKKKAADEAGALLIAPLIHRGNEALQDVLAWLTAQQSAGAQKK